jgi:hypothetical protein
MNSLSESSPSAAVAPVRPQTRRLRLWRILGAAILVMLLALAFQAWRIARAGQAVYEAALALATTAQSDLSLETIPQLQPQVAELAGAMTHLDAQLRLVYPVLKWLEWVPTYGPTLAATPHLLTAGRELLWLGSEGLAFAAPALAAPDQAARVAEVISLLETEPETLQRLADYAGRAEQALLLIPSDQLHPRLANSVAEAQTLMPALTAGLQIGPRLPALIGMKEPVTYVILVQNSDELRATGGFISAVGTVKLDQGQLLGLDFVDSYLFTHQDLAYPPAPGPMQKYMNIPLLVLRDANWSPDLPTSAQLFKAIYQHDTGTALDGIVTVDLRAVELIIGALSPLHIPSMAEPLTGATVIEQIKQMWTVPEESGSIEEDFLQWWINRKDFIPELANSAQERLRSDEVDYVGLAFATQRALDERAIQIWVDDPEVAAHLAATGWDGALHPQPEADFLALVDTNMGYNKVNAVIERALEYQVHWPNGPDKPAHATVTITYTHPLTTTETACDNAPVYGKTYDDLVRRCFFNYLRLYTPAGSQLVEIDGIAPNSAESQRGEAGTQLFAGFFVVPIGAQQRITLRYTLPAGLTPDNYTLLLQRQAGAGPLPLQIDVAGEAHATTLTGGRLRWSTARP